MDDRRFLAGRFSLAACAVAAVLVTMILFGGIDVLADHYASAHRAVQAAAQPGPEAG